MWSMPTSGISSCLGTGGVAVRSPVSCPVFSSIADLLLSGEMNRLRAAGVAFMIPTQEGLHNIDLLRDSPEYGDCRRDRPADRWAAARERPALLPGHRRTGVALGARGEAPGGPARGRRGDPRLRGDDRADRLRLAQPRLRRALLRGT